MKRHLYLWHCTFQKHLHLATMRRKWIRSINISRDYRYLIGRIANGSTIAVLAVFLPWLTMMNLESRESLPKNIEWRNYNYLTVKGNRKLPAEGRQWKLENLWKFSINNIIWTNESFRLLSVSTCYIVELTVSATTFYPISKEFASMSDSTTEFLTELAEAKNFCLLKTFRNNISIEVAHVRRQTPWH